MGALGHSRNQLSNCIISWQGYCITFVCRLLSDIALTFRTTFVNKNGWIVADPRQIAVNYLRTWFAVDLVAALPVDTISHLFHIDFVSKHTL